MFFYEGLLPDLKIASAYKFETISSFTIFKTEMRKLEEEMKKTTSRSGKKSTVCNAANRRDGAEGGQETSELGQVKSLLQQLNDRIDRLEKQNEFKHSEQPHGHATSLRGSRGPRHCRGNSSQTHCESNTRPFRGQGRGSSSYLPRRPTASGTFRPNGVRCFVCNETGHMARSCPLNK